MKNFEKFQSIPISDPIPDSKWAKCAFLSRAASIFCPEVVADLNSNQIPSPNSNSLSSNFSASCKIADQHPDPHPDPHSDQHPDPHPDPHPHPDFNKIFSLEFQCLQLTQNAKKICSGRVPVQFLNGIQEIFSNKIFDSEKENLENSKKNSKERKKFLIFCDFSA